MLNVVFLYDDIDISLVAKRTAHSSFTVKGMTCASCVDAVENVVKNSLKGIVSVSCVVIFFENIIFIYLTALQVPPLL